MPSGIDLLRGTQSVKSGKELLGQGQTQGRITSGIELLNAPTIPIPENPVPTLTPSTAPESNMIDYEWYQDKIKQEKLFASPEPFYSRMSKLVDPSQDITDPTLLKSPTQEERNGAMIALNRLWGLAKNPYDVVKGTAEFVASLPGFGMGIVGAGVETTKEIGSRMIKSEDFTLLDLYESASKGMEEQAGRWHESMVAPLGRVLDYPKKAGEVLSDLVTGAKPSEEPEPIGDSAFIGEVAMAPLTASSAILRKIPDHKIFDYSPNLRGAGYFLSDVISMLIFGRIYKGGTTKLVKDMEPIANKMADLVDKQEKINAIPDEVIKKAQQEVLNVEIKQAELEAWKIKEKLDAKEALKEDVKAKGKKVKEVKEGKVKEEVKVEEPITSGKELLKEKKPKKAKKKEVVIEEPTTPLDNQLGIPDPVDLGTETNPFRDKPEETQALKKHFARIKDTVLEDPDLMLGKLINDVNRWLDGEDLPIDKVRDYLSELVVRADEVRGRFDSLEYFNEWRETASDAAEWARKTDRLDVKQSDFKLTSGIDPTEFFNRMRRLHPATFPVRAQKLMADIANNLGVTDVLDIFGGIGNIGGMKKYGYKGKISANEIEPKWGGVSTIVEQKRRGVDISTIGDSRHLKNKDNSVQAIFTSPTYGNLMGLKSPSKKDSYQAFAGGKLEKGNTGGEVWGPKYEQLHREVYDEAFRVVRPGGYFVLNMKDKPITATSQKNRWIPKKGSTVFVEDNIMKATDWHVKALEDAGFKTVDRMTFDEPNIIKGSGTQKFGRKFSVGYEDVVVLQKPLVRLIDKRTGDTKLYDITGATTEAVKQLVAGAKRLSEYTKQARGMKSFKPKQAAQMLREEFNRSFIDRSGNIRGRLLDELGEQGYEIIQKMYLSKGASSQAANMLKQMRKEVYAGLSLNEKRVLDNLILADRMIDIGKYKTGKQFKFPEGLNPKDSAAYNELFQYIEKLTPNVAESLKRRAKAYFEWMKKPLKDMLDAELITQEEHDALASHNYRRLKIVDVYDKRYQSKLGKKKRTIYDSGVEALAHGRETDVFEPSSEIMALEVFNRAYGRIMNNRANQALLDVARTDHTNPFVRVKDSKKDKIPTGWNQTFVYDKGERKAMYLSPEMSKEWITNNPEISYKMGQILRWSTMSPVLRTFATGINWGFALANLPRDIMHTWFTAREFKDGKWKPIYNPNLPIFGVQMLRDQLSVFSDAALRKGRYNDYIEQGGGMEFLVHQGRLFQRGRHIETEFSEAMNFLGYFGETSEILTRLAIRERALRKGKSAQEATFIARDYMDFGQGGGIAKALDNAIPYLNASIQGTRGLVRAFKPGSDSALSSTYKLAQFGALTVGLYIAMQKMHPESSKDLKASLDSQNNICLPLGDDFGFEDEKGQMRYPYIKIPIDPGQKFFKKFFEAATDKWLGNEVDVDGTVNALEQFSPVGVSSLPPTIGGALGYVTNKDFWSNEDIWRKTDKPFGYPESREEYIPGQTPQAFIDFGAATGLSPERTKYLVEELTTNGTLWSYLLDQGYDAAFGDMPKSKKEQHLAMTLSKIPVIKRFFGVTNPYTKYGTSMDESKEQSDIQRWIQTRGLDARVEGYLYDDTVSRKEVVDYMASFKDKKVYDRLKERFTFQEKTKDLPNRTFWLRLRGLTTEARAKVYVERLNKSNEEERQQLNKEMATVIQAGGVMSSEFREEVGKLRE